MLFRSYQRHASQLPANERKPEVAEKAWGECSAAFDVLEDTLKKKKWLAGSDFSIADLNVASALYRALTVDLSKWPHVKTWLAACWERPAAKQARAMREGK